MFNVNGGRLKNSSSFVPPLIVCPRRFLNYLKFVMRIFKPSSSTCIWPGAMQQGQMQQDRDATKFKITYKRRLIM